MTAKGPAAEIISFYSYKGGVGRSMAVANVGRLLADRAPVLLIDWDLEAPGLYQYFRRLVDDKSPGLIDFFSAKYPDCMREQPTGKLIAGAAEIENFILSIAGLEFLPAGRQDRGYPGLVSSFSWSALHRDHPHALSEFRGRLAERYAYVLIDSRTGASDAAGVSTALMADKLVAMFAPNTQNLEGLKRTIPQILTYRRTSPDERPLTVFPVPSRFDTLDLGQQQSYLTDFRDMFSEMFREQYGLESVDLREHFGQTMLPYVASYSYGERIVVAPEEPDNPGSLRAAYERLTDRLLRDVPWRELRSP